MSVSSRAGSSTPFRRSDGFGYLDQEEHAVIYIGMDVHQKSTTFCLFDPSAEKERQYRPVTRPTTVQAYEEVLRPHDGHAIFLGAPPAGEK